MYRELQNNSKAGGHNKQVFWLIFRLKYMVFVDFKYIKRCYRAPKP